MLFGYTLGHSKPQDLLRWNADSICQWLDDFTRIPKTTRPHVNLLTFTGANAKEDEIPRAELASLATASPAVWDSQNSKIPHSSQFSASHSLGQDTAAS